MRVVHVSSEIAPYNHSGGLGDVVGALPPALAAAGLPAVVVGRALYDRRFTLAEAIAAAAG